MITKKENNENSNQTKSTGSKKEKLTEIERGNKSKMNNYQ